MAAASFCCTCCRHHEPSTRHQWVRRWLRRRAHLVLFALHRLFGRRDGL